MNVLLVDDQEKILEATKKLVDWESLGVAEVFTADNAAAARRILASQAVEIVLVDIEMPGENGIELQKWIAEEYPQTACIFLTSHADFGYAQEAIRGGAFDYILQPASFAEIEKVVGRCIRRMEEKKQILTKARQYDDSLSGDYLANEPNLAKIRRPDGALWGRWLIRQDTALVKNQIENLCRLAEEEGYLTVGYLQKVVHAFLEACSIACYEQKKNLSDLFDERFTYEEMLHACSSAEKLCEGVEFCLNRYQNLISENGGDTTYSVQERIAEILRYLEENMDRMISRREAAKYVFLNEDYFSRMFRKETGMGYKEYVLKQKMDYAGKLLRETKMPVALVASKVGYENYTNFTQMFRKSTGMTPTDYRKETLEGGKSEN
ncbi:MAG: response regulator [Eubacteriales bacterium]|nr:response regulator [Eubacteriales bacterium]